MSDTPERFYITTAIDYPNGVPHMGHAYEKVIADFYARAARLRGLDAWFLIGLDEHGQKIQNAAEEASMSPQAFVDEKAEVFLRMYDRLEISNTDFIRTSETRHHRWVQRLYEKVRDRGDLYKGIYKSQYCTSCESNIQKSDVAAGKCLVDEKRALAECPVQEVEEESYFFRLGKYRDAVREHIERHPEFVVPLERRNEVLARLQGEVHDLSISRSTFQWGIPLPDDPEHVIYVWFDALSNYASALEEPDPGRRRFWPADCHVIGKDILWFHTVIWPAMLLSAGIPLPRQVYAHGFILDGEGRKMAKSLGNVIDPMEIIEEYGVDVLRYYFLKAFSSGQDGRFSIPELEERYKTELGNDLGNLVMRLSKLSLTRAGGRLDPAAGFDDLGQAAVAEEYFHAVDAREHHRALEALWGLLRRVNAYLNEKAPWKVTDESEVRRILYSAFEATAWCLRLLEPAMPATAKAAAEVLGVALGPLPSLEGGTRAYEAKPARPLFPRREPPGRGAAGAAVAGEKKERKKRPKTPPAPVDPFAKLEIRVGVIEEVREHPDADALWAITIDVGGEARSVCAGLRAHVSAAELQGRKVLVLANLKPARLRGIESRGMVLATDRRDGKIVPVDPGDASSGDLALVEGIEPAPKKKLSTRDFEKAPLEMRGGRVTYRGKPLRTPAGEITADAEDGAEVR